MDSWGDYRALRDTLTINKTMGGYYGRKVNVIIEKYVRKIEESHPEYNDRYDKEVRK